MAANSDWATYTTQPFIPIYLSDEDIALLFTEYVDGSQPSHLTIVILRKGSATVVFNKEYFLNSIHMNRNSFRADLQSNTVKWIDNKPLEAPDLSQIQLKNGILTILKK